MTPAAVVVDASVAVKWVLPEAHTDRAQALMAASIQAPQRPGCAFLVRFPSHKVVHLQRAGKYQRPAWRSSQGQKRPRREGSHGLPAALSPLVTPSTPAVWTHIAGSGPLP